MAISSSSVSNLFSAQTFVSLPVKCDSMSAGHQPEVSACHIGMRHNNLPSFSRITYCTCKGVCHPSTGVGARFSPVWGKLNNSMMDYEMDGGTLKSNPDE